MTKRKIKIQAVDFYKGFFEKTFKNRLEALYELEISEQPDFLFYSVYGTGREHFNYDNCVKILWCVEGVIPDFNECDYAIGSYPMSVGDRYLQIPYTGMNPDAQNREQYRDADIGSRKFCNFVYSNPDRGKGAIIRQEFCRKLMEYKHVDCPGKVLNNMPDAIAPRHGKGWVQGKIDFIKNYKFTIAFENASMPGMITEKMTQAFEAGTVPIYWGDPYVTDVYNSDAFINCIDFNSWDDVIEKVKELDNDDEKYRKMLLTPPMLPQYHQVGNEEIVKFLQYIIERGNTPFEKDPLGWDAGSLAGTQLEEMKNNVFYRLYMSQKKGGKVIDKIFGRGK